MPEEELKALFNSDEIIEGYNDAALLVQRIARDGLPPKNATFEELLAEESRKRLVYETWTTAMDDCLAVQQFFDDPANLHPTSDEQKAGTTFIIEKLAKAYVAFTDLATSGDLIEYTAPLSSATKEWADGMVNGDIEQFNRGKKAVTETMRRVARDAGFPV